MSLEFESLIQNGPNPSGLSCISPIHSFCHVSCMHHIVALCLVLIVLRCVHRGRFCLRGYFRVSSWRAVPLEHSVGQATTPFDHIDTIPCSRSCSHLLHLRQQRFKLLCAAVVEPISSAWPVFATVTRWNPLACVGVVWAMSVFPTSWFHFY